MKKYAINAQQENDVKVFNAKYESALGAYMEFDEDDGKLYISLHCDSEVYNQGNRLLTDVGTLDEAISLMENSFKPIMAFNENHKIKIGYVAASRLEHLKPFRVYDSHAREVQDFAALEETTAFAESYTGPEPVKVYDTKEEAIKAGVAQPLHYHCDECGGYWWQEFLSLHAPVVCPTCGCDDSIFVRAI